MDHAHLRSRKRTITYLLCKDCCSKDAVDSFSLTTSKLKFFSPDAHPDSRCEFLTTSRYDLNSFAWVIRALEKGKVLWIDHLFRQQGLP